MIMSLVAVNTSTSCVTLDRHSALLSRSCMILFTASSWLDCHLIRVAWSACQDTLVLESSALLSSMRWICL